MNYLLYLVSGGPTTVEVPLAICTNRVFRFSFVFCLFSNTGVLVPDTASTVALQYAVLRQKCSRGHHTRVPGTVKSSLLAV